MLRRSTAYVLTYLISITGFWAVCPPPTLAAEAVSRAPFLPGGFGAVGVGRGPSSSAALPALASALRSLLAQAGAADSKITICHVPPGNPDNRHTISVSTSAWPAHEAHGDTIGACAPPPPPPTECEGFWGPLTFTRTTGPKNVYTVSVNVPAWTVNPFTLRVQNGHADGRDRVSSAWIEVNGAQVAVPSDFNPNVASFTRQVTLTPTTTLQVTLASKPASFLTLNLCGTSGDYTPPEIAVETPANGSFSSDMTPDIVVRYSDPVGPGEPGASGVDPSTLKILVDDVDRTDLFIRGPAEATATLPASLALGDGSHRVVATIRDFAGNQSSPAVSEFVVDVTPPVVRVEAPPRHTPGNDVYLPSLTQPVRVSYSDNHALDLGTLRVLVNGVDRTALFAVGPSEATATLDASTGLVEAANDIRATIKDRAANAAVPEYDVAQFNIDVEKPKIWFDEPLPEARPGVDRIHVQIGYSDDQALDLATFEFEVDGDPMVLTQGPSGAHGEIGPLTQARHRLTASIKDRAGNPRDATVEFVVDLEKPFIRVIEPSGVIAESTPLVAIEYADPEIDTATLKVKVTSGAGQTVDLTPIFTPQPDRAIARIPPSMALADGPYEAVATISDLSKNEGESKSRFTVDTTPPTGRFIEPPALTRERLPRIVAEYEDVTTRVVPESVEVRLDAADTPIDCGAASATRAVCFPPSPLPDGEHHLRISFKDEAGNAGSATHRFTVDATPPEVALVKPVDERWINDPTPDFEATYGDLGSGIKLDTFQVFLRRGSETEENVTAYFTAGPARATGTLPEAQRLADDTYHWRVVIGDTAGNVRDDVVATFRLDTQKPTYRFDQPPAIVATATPRFEIAYSDDNSGVDTGAFRFTIAEIDLTSRLTVGPSRAEGALPAGDALSDGSHTADAFVIDRAGNVADPAPRPFTVDTRKPEVKFETPAEGAFLNVSAVPIRATYKDEGGVGVAASFVRVLVNGATRTTEFAPTDSVAQATLTLPDNEYQVTVHVPDYAGNEGSAERRFTVDTTPPAIVDVQPPEGSFLRQAVPITGRVIDADPNVAVTCKLGAASVAATVNAGEFTCSVPLAQYVNAITIEAVDRAQNKGTHAHTVIYDHTPPRVFIEEPDAGDVTSALSIDVSGRVEDEYPDKVWINGQEGSIQSDKTFVVPGVSLENARDVSLVPTARDKAGNDGGGDPVVIHVDRDAPVIVIQVPANEDWIRGPMQLVEGTVEDASPVVVEVNGVEANVSGNRFSVTIPAPEGPFPPLPIVANAHDVANNKSGTAIQVYVDATAPKIFITSPAANVVTNADQVAVAGTIADASLPRHIELQINGATLAVGSDGHFAGTVPLGTTGLEATATDLAQNVGHLTHPVVRDQVKPVVTIETPQPNAVITNPSLTVAGKIEDDHPRSVKLNGGAAQLVGNAWQTTLTSLTEGPLDLKAEGDDEAGNDAEPVTVPVRVDLYPPVITLEPPPAPCVTQPTLVVRGTVVDAGGLKDVTVNGQPVATIPAGAGRWEFTTVVELTEGPQRTTIAALAHDIADRPAGASIEVVLDSFDPAVTLEVPDRITRGKTYDATGSVTEASLDTLVAKIDNGPDIPLPAQPSFQFPITVPPGRVAGDTFLVLVTATDCAGRTKTVTKPVTVAADGVLTGQVLSDATGLPLAGATVRQLDSSEPPATTDGRGRYSINAGAAVALLVIEKAGFTSIEREVAVATGTGTVPVDARLTPLEPPKPPSSDAVAAGSITIGQVFLPIRLTPLTPQGLPNLLPLGWSPLLAFDVYEDTPSAATWNVSVAGLTAEGAHLVQYRPGTHAWHLVALGVTANTPVPLAGPGGYAIVVADGEDAPLPPAVGEPLTGLEVVALPVDVVSRTAAVPASLLPEGGTATGHVLLEPSTSLPSGTVVQAEVAEKYELATEQQANEEPRRIDVVLHRLPTLTELAAAPGTLTGAFRITPTQRFDNTELLSGNLHLDILAGREMVRGTIGGASEALSLTLDDIQVTIPANSLTKDAAFGVGSSGISRWVPRPAQLDAIAELSVNFGGETLAHPAEISVDGANLDPNGIYVVARVERFDGIPYMAVVSRAVLQGGRLVSQASEPLPGIRTEGRFVFYRSTLPIGFVAGRVLNATARPLVQATGAGTLPFVAWTNAAGGQYDYVLTSSTGPTDVIASVPDTALFVRMDDVPVNADTATPLTLSLQGANATATVSIANGAQGVPAETAIEIASTVPLEADSVMPANVRLLKVANNVPVAVRIVLSTDRRVVTIVPTIFKANGEPDTDKPALEASTQYALTVTGLEGEFGQAVLVPSVSFTTAAVKAPEFDPNALVFSMPDAEGLVHVTGPVAAGAQILIINYTSGFVASFSSTEAGVNETIPATISDKLVITINWPDGTFTTFTKSEFHDPVTGETAIGVGGGVVKSADGTVELRIPEGALTKGVKWKITGLTRDQLEEQYPGQQPDPTDEDGVALAHVGPGLRIEASEPVEMKKEADLVFPIPDFSSAPANEQPTNPEDAWYYVFRRLEGPCPPDNPQCAVTDRKVRYETIDHAFVECPPDKSTCTAAEKKVVTASYPFRGFGNTAGSFGMGGSILAGAVSMLITAWSVDPQSDESKPRLGVITGKVQRAKWRQAVPDDPATTDVDESQASRQEFEGIGGARLSGEDSAGDSLSGVNPWTPYAISQGDGTYTMFDRRRNGGTVQVRATINSAVDGPCGSETTQCATTYQTSLPQAALSFYPLRALANILFPAIQPTTPPPAISIHVFREVPDGQNTRLEEVTGITVQGTPLLIGFKNNSGGTDYTVNAALVQGETKSVRRPTDADPQGFDWFLNDTGRTDGKFVPDTAGSYTVAVTALPALGAAITTSKTIRVIASSNAPVDAVEGPPQVLVGMTVPKKDATGVPVDVFPQIFFSEPVTNVTPDTLELLEVTDSGTVRVPVVLSGVDTTGTAVEPIAPDTKVTAVTLLPRTGLKFKARYILRAGNAIKDTDKNQQGEDAPKSLVSCELDADYKPIPDRPCDSGFETFGPEALPGSNSQEPSIGISVIGDRAYLVENLFYTGTLKGFDISDPATPIQTFSQPGAVPGRPLAMAGAFDDGSVVGEGTKLVTVIATLTLRRPAPTNAWLFDVTTDSPRLLGMATLYATAGNGYIQPNMVQKGGFAYALNLKNGVSVIDLGAMRNNYAALEPGTSDYAEAWRGIYTDGRGWGEGAISTVPVKTGDKHWWLSDLDVGDLSMDGSSQRLVVVTGAPPGVIGQPSPGVWLAVANPSNPNSQPQIPLKTADGAYQMAGGGSVALARLTGSDLGDLDAAVVTGYGLTPLGSGKPMLLVVDMRTPAAPSVIGAVVTETGGDLVVKDNIAYVVGGSFVQMISLSDPTQPTLAGKVFGNFGGHIALNEDGNVLFSTAHSMFGGLAAGLNGVRALALQLVPVIKRISPVPLVVRDGKTFTNRDVTIDFGTVPATHDFTTGKVEITRNGDLVDTLDAVVTNNEGRAIWPSNREFDPKDTYRAEAILDPGTDRELRSFPRRIVPLFVDLDVDSDNNNELAEPARSGEEEDREDLTGNVQRPGKVVSVNGGDRDADGIPNFADGTQLFDQAGENKSQRFASIVFELPADVDSNTARVKFAYSGSDPLGVQRSGSESDGYTYTPASGALRLWTKDGDKQRNATALAQGGDYVAPNVEQPVARLSTPIRERTYRFFVEGIDYSREVADQVVKVDVVANHRDGSEVRISDQVRLTVLETRLVEALPDNVVKPVGAIAVSHPSPVVTVTNAQFTNLRLNADASGLVADLAIAGEVSCAVCDFTPGATGMLDGLRVFLNGSEEPLPPVVPLSMSKASGANSFLRPYVLSASFSGVVAGVSVDLGTNRVRVETADKVQNITGYAEILIDIQGAAPAPHVTNYRVSLDFGNAESLAELTPDRAVRLTVIDKAQTPEVVYSADVYRDPVDLAVVFRNADARVLIHDSLALEGALSPLQHGTVPVTVVLSGAMTATVVGILEETGPATGLLRRRVVDLLVTKAGPFAQNAPDQLQATVDDGRVAPQSTVLTETGSATQIFASDDGGFVLRITSPEDEGSSVLNVAVSHAMLGISDEPIVLGEVASGSGIFVSNEGIEAYAPEDYQGWIFSVSTARPGAASSGGQLRAFMLQVLGPELFVSQIDHIETADGPRRVQRAFDGNYYVFMKNTRPLPIEVVPVSAGAAGIDDPITIPDEVKFFGGFIAGFFLGGVDLIEGLITGVAKLAYLATLETLRTHPLGVVYVMAWGDKYKSEREFARATKDLVLKLAKLYLQVMEDDEAIIVAMLSGDLKEAAEISAPYAAAFEYGGEFFKGLAEAYIDAPSEKQGEIFGRAIFEVAMVLVPYAKAGTLAKLSKLEFLTALRARPFFRHPRVARAFDRIAAFMGELATTKMCFVAGTPIVTSSGLKTIETIQAGDLVLSRDPKAMVDAYKSVVETVVTHPTRLYHVTYHRPREECADDAHSSGDDHSLLVATAEHPFFVVKRAEFVPAKNLSINDEFALARGGTARVASIRIQDAAPGETFTTYNFEVEDFHTYFAGSDGVWVHNTGIGQCQRIKSIYNAFLKRSPDDPVQAFQRTLGRLTPKGAGHEAKGSMVKGTIDEISNLKASGKLNRHLAELGEDTSRGFLPRESFTGGRFEKLKGKRLRRSTVADEEWIDEAEQAWDAFGPLPAEHYNWSQVKASIDAHFRKQKINTVFDFAGLKPAQKEQMRAYIVSKLRGAKWYEFLDD